MRTEVRFRPWLAVASTLLLHGMIALAVLYLPAQDFVPLRRVTDIVLIAQPVIVEPETVPEAVPDEEPIPDITETLPVEDPANPPADASPPTVADLPPVSARSAQADADTTSTSDDAFPLSPGTRSVLQRLQCPGDPEAFALTGTCPQGAGRSDQMAAAAPTASDYFGIDVATIRAEFGLAPHALSGRPTLDTGTQRRSLSNADSMRDMLPASRPDPAFGD